MDNDRIMQRLNFAIAAGITTVQEIADELLNLGVPRNAVPSNADLLHVMNKLVPTPEETTMTTETPAIIERMTKIVTEHLGVSADRVTANAKITDDLGADSLDKVELLMALEEEFGIEIPDEHEDQFTTVSSAVNYIERSLSGQAVS